MLKDGSLFLKDYSIILSIPKSFHRKSSLVSSSSTSNTNSRTISTSSTDSNLEVSLSCFHPRVAFNALKKTSSVILTSGTLSPLIGFESELGCSFPIQYEGGHVIDLHRQVLVGTVSTGPSGRGKLNCSYKESNSIDFMDDLGDLFLQFCRIISEGGILIFFPSYSFMEKLFIRWKATDLWEKLEKLKHIFIEESSSTSNSNFITTIRKFYDCNSGAAAAAAATSVMSTRMENKDVSKIKKSGGIFFAICRGKVSEGIDFSDDRCRLCVVVGIPFPNVSDFQVDLKKKFNTSRKDMINGNSWYTQQAYRAVNQAIGRTIRHQNDWGAILLIDERWEKRKGHIEGLSKWIRPITSMLFSFLFLNNPFNINNQNIVLY